MYDVVIRNGKVINGAGNPWFPADVAVSGGKIVKIGKTGEAEAHKVIDASGQCVTPGFIDGHSHSDLYIIANPKAEQKAMQGITTENVGLDGLSLAPIEEKDIETWKAHLSGLGGNPGLEWTWRSFGDYLDAIDKAKPSINACSYVGLGAIRLKVMGMGDEPAGANDIEKMKVETQKAMEEGARGVSTGLIYPPCVYQSTEEMVEMCKVSQRYGGIFDVHMRSESEGLMKSIDEVLEIGRLSGIPVHITHFKSMGRKNFGRAAEALEKLDKARQDGIDVTIAQYPYIAGSTMLHAILPPWLHKKGPEKLVDTLKNERASVHKDIYENMNWENFLRNITWDDIFVSSVESEANKRYEGKTISQIASMMKLDDPLDAACDLLIQENLAVGMVSFSMDEGDVVNIMKHPTTCFITDGLLGGSKPHPRVYGTMPRILGRYVREQKILSLEDAVRKMTSASAQRLGLQSKGLIAENFDADIVVFDPDTVIDKATFEEPRQFSDGISWVLVNGQVVVENGKHTGAGPGKTVR